VNIKATHQHPKYTVKLRYDDIALLELEREIALSDDNPAIKPACLYTNHVRNPNLMNFTIAGWGRNDREDRELACFLGNSNESFLFP